jgi:5-methylcytosine-specific restriction enzyme subunit McrC
MMAYGRIYQCSLLVLLYPHHAGLPGSEGVVGRYSVNGSEDILTTATIDVSTSNGILERLRALADVVIQKRKTSNSEEREGAPV